MNSLTKNFSYFNKIIKLFQNNQDDFTKLHRWCTIISPIYKDTCNWEKKMDMAAKDNCYHNYSQKIKEEVFVDPINSNITIFHERS